MNRTPVVALWLFHARVGARLAMRSSALLFSALVAAVMLQMYPAAVLGSIAKALFGPRPDRSAEATAALLALVLALWAAPRMWQGLGGWIRHLPASGVAMRRGLALGLAVVEAPLAAALAFLFMLVPAHGAGSLGRWIVVMAAAVYAAVPVRRRALTASLGVAAAVLAINGAALAGALLLFVADVFAGELRDAGRPRRWSPARELLVFRIAWRAVGRKLAGAYAAAALPLGAAALFLANNALPADLAAASARFGATLSLVLFVAALAAALAERRPPWPWARSLPWTAGRRVAADALFIGAHAAALLVPAAALGRSAHAAALALPYLALRASAQVRGAIRQRRTGPAALLMEGFAAAALIALLPWAVLAACAATPLAFIAAREAERRHKTTQWLELRHSSLGDPLSWSGV